MPIPQTKKNAIFFDFFSKTREIGGFRVMESMGWMGEMGLMSIMGIMDYGSCFFGKLLRMAFFLMMDNFSRNPPSSENFTITFFCSLSSRKLHW